MTKKIMSLMMITGMAVWLLASPVSAVKPDHAGGGKPGGEKPPTVQLKSVCIDAGHGGNDGGASSADGSIKESDLNLDVAKALEARLSTSGYETHMTRTTYGQTMSNNDRYTRCNATNATSLISIHHNGSTNQSVDYTSGLYSQRQSLGLATIVGQAVADEFGQAGTFRTERFPSGVLIKSDMPSMISEGYFLTSQNRSRQLVADYSRMVAREADAIHRGLEEYYLLR